MQFEWAKMDFGWRRYHRNKIDVVLWKGGKFLEKWHKRIFKEKLHRRVNRRTYTNGRKTPPISDLWYIRLEVGCMRYQDLGGADCDKAGSNQRIGSAHSMVYGKNPQAISYAICRCNMPWCDINRRIEESDERSGSYQSDQWSAIDDPQYKRLMR